MVRVCVACTTVGCRVTCLSELVQGLALVLEQGLVRGYSPRNLGVMVTIKVRVGLGLLLGLGSGLWSSTGTCTCTYKYLNTILSVLDVLEYLIGENAKYLYLIQSTL